MSFHATRNRADRIPSAPGKGHGDIFQLDSPTRGRSKPRPAPGMERHPQIAPMTLMYKAGEWQELSTLDTPSFYFYRDGKLASQVIGWPEKWQYAGITEGIFRAGHSHRRVTRTGVLLLARGDGDVQPILRRRQRTGGERREGARRVVGAVEVQHHLAGFIEAAGRQRGVEEARGTVSLLAGGAVGKDEKQLAAGFFLVGQQLKAPSVTLEHRAPRHRDLVDGADRGADLERAAARTAPNRPRCARPDRPGNNRGRENACASALRRP